jgi:hypothetical protein
MSVHVQAVLGSSALSLYAIKTLRSHGLSTPALHRIYRSVVVARLMYAASAWWGFANLTDLQCINAFLRRGVKCGLCPPDIQTFEELCQAADDKLFKTVLNNNEHVLHKLPPQRNAFNCYNIRNSCMLTSVQILMFLAFCRVLSLNEYYYFNLSEIMR